uniref:Cathepsin L-1 n=1 Tax=Dermanyssus gallinae TaxID=34641 RepID=G3C8U0_9ACAR|nr:Cathepsin L-1 [Dermanyssus gallinae]
MRPLMVFCVLSIALLPSTFASPEAAESKWRDFKARHAKQHAPHEELERRQRFLEKDAEIEAHNARYAAGLETFSRRHSQYSDLSDAEFAEVALGFTPAVNASDIPEAQLEEMPSMPQQFDWRSYGIMTPVKNQLYCGSCYAFAVAGALEAYLKWTTGRNFDLSEQDVVDCSYHIKGRMNNGCKGGWPTHVYNYYNQKDLVMENQYPYTSGTRRIRGQCQFYRPLTDFVQNRLNIRNLRPRNEDEMAQLLVSKGPLTVAIAADNEYKQFFNELGDGVFNNANAIGLSPNHAVVLAGLGVQNGQKYWLIKNSWGTEWGVGGYGKIARGLNMCGILKFGVFFVE